MSSGKHFTAEFILGVSALADNYLIHQDKADSYQWAIAERVIVEWRSQYEGEINKLEYYKIVSEIINADLRRPICSASGETLRRWCNLYETFENMPAAQGFREALSAEHFRVSKMLANLPNTDGYLDPVFFLAIAYDEHLTFNELNERYNPHNTEPVHEYDRTLGWLDSLQAQKFEWIKDIGARRQVRDYFEKARVILENYK